MVWQEGLTRPIPLEKDHLTGESLNERLRMMGEKKRKKRKQMTTRSGDSSHPSKGPRMNRKKRVAKKEERWHVAAGC